MWDHSKVMIYRRSSRNKSSAYSDSIDSDTSNFLSNWFIPQVHKKEKPDSLFYAYLAVVIGRYSRIPKQYVEACSNWICGQV